MRRAHGIVLIALSLAAGTAAADDEKAPPAFELRDGDRVVFLGGTFVERMQRYGYVEAALTARWPDRNITFRNLGWSGDTVWAESRGLFDPPAKGYARMLEHVGRLKPTVVFLGYGNVESFAGEKGLPAFVKQYEKLLDDLTRVSAKGVRFVLLGPHYGSRIVEIGPDRGGIASRDLSSRPSPESKNIVPYSDAISLLARKRRYAFVGTGIDSTPEPRTLPEGTTVVSSLNEEFFLSWGGFLLHRSRNLKSSTTWHILADIGAMYGRALPEIVVDGQRIRTEAPPGGRPVRRFLFRGRSSISTWGSGSPSRVSH